MGNLFGPTRAPKIFWDSSIITFERFLAVAELLVIFIIQKFFLVYRCTKILQIERMYSTDELLSGYLSTM